jgi:hypothetical protein
MDGPVFFFAHVVKFRNFTRTEYKTLKRGHTDED